MTLKNFIIENNIYFRLCGGIFTLLKFKYQMYYNSKFYASLGNKIIVKKEDESRWTNYITIRKLKLINYFELYNRLLRHGIHNFYKINEDTDCIIIKRSILFYKNRKLINTLNLENGSRPLRNGIVYKNDYIIYSEYYGNINREPINIYKYNFNENKKEILYTFNNIRHIHFIQQNISNPDLLYIGTGDLDDECGIYIFSLKKGNIKQIGGGSQSWRAVSILQSNNALYWGTDDPIGKNFIMRHDFEDNKLTKIQEIDGPAYYSSITKNKDMFIATTVEDKKKHKAIIYKKNKEKWGNYMEFNKDIFHTKYFGYGLIEFINNQEALEELIYNLNGLKLENKNLLGCQK